MKKHPDKIPYFQNGSPFRYERSSEHSRVSSILHIYIYCFVFHIILGQILRAFPR